MKETKLWDHLRPEMSKLGHFQKINDRFTSGIPDVLGAAQSRPIAMELKEFKGVRILSVKFRPLQLDWLRDWETAGGSSFILSSHGPRTVYLHHWSLGDQLEQGVSPDQLEELALFKFIKGRSDTWAECAKEIIYEATQ